MKILIKAILFLSFSFQGFSQEERLKLYVVDSTDNSPLSFVHVFDSRDKAKGTITNEDGYAILKGISRNDSLTISFLGYKTRNISAQEFTNDTVFLQPLNEQLDEIVLTNISAREILLKVISRMEENHSVEPVLYDVFLRSSYHSPEMELHLLEEQFMKVYQGENHRSKFRFDQGRVRPFSKKGDSIFKNYRMINATYLFTNNLFIFKHDVLKPRKLKNYTIEYEPSSDDEIINIICFQEGDSFKTKLSIDRETYGILLFTPRVSDTSIEEIYFQKLDGKFYLSSFRQKRGFWKKDLKEISHALYTVAELNAQEVEVKGWNAMIDVTKAKKYMGKWDDDFWKENQFLPLPQWIKEQVTK